MTVVQMFKVSELLSFDYSFTLLFQRRLFRYTSPFADSILTIIFFGRLPQSTSQPDFTMADAEEDVVESNFPMDTATLLQMQPLAAGLSRLYCSEDFTDLEIICQERVWKVHKLCLCAQSDFF